MQFRNTIVAGLVVASLAGGVALAQVSTPHGPNPTAAKMKNPIPANAESIARGKKVYEARCAQCHLPTGTGGEGHGESGPAPPDLTRPQLDHGQSDGEIYAIVWGGVLPDLFMPMFEGEISSNEAWDVVNYVQQVLRKKK